MLGPWVKRSAVLSVAGCVLVVIVSIGLNTPARRTTPDRPVVTLDTPRSDHPTAWRPIPSAGDVPADIGQAIAAEGAVPVQGAVLGAVISGGLAFVLSGPAGKATCASASVLKRSGKGWSLVQRLASGVGPAPPALERVPEGFFAGAVDMHGLPSMSVTTSAGVGPGASFLRLACADGLAVAQVDLAPGGSDGGPVRAYGTTTALAKSTRLTLAHGIGASRS